MSIENIKPYELSIWSDDLVEGLPHFYAQENTTFSRSFYSKIGPCKEPRTFYSIVKWPPYSLDNLYIDQDHPFTVSSLQGQITVTFFLRDINTGQQGGYVLDDIQWTLDEASFIHYGNYQVDSIDFPLKIFIEGVEQTIARAYIFERCYINQNNKIEYEIMTNIIVNDTFLRSYNLEFVSGSFYNRGDKLTTFSYYIDQTPSRPDSYYKENKIAVIGSDSLNSYNAAHDITLKKNKNGEKTLEFTIRHKYFDPQTQQMVVNPYAKYLINERKVKLFYENEWHDFIIKECNETSEEYEFRYVAQDAFVLELSKNGYNITFDKELNNNQGSAMELAQKTLEETNWTAIDIDLKPPTINEPIYHSLLMQQFNVIDMDSGEETTIEAGKDIAVFYSYVANQNGIGVQFIIEENDDLYEIDSHNNIIAKNYRFEEELVYKESTQPGVFGSFYLASDPTQEIIRVGYLLTKYQAYRYIYQQLAHYDPVMQQVVKEYEVDGKDFDIYQYTNTVYTTSDVVMSYVTSGNTFNTYAEGSLEGWSRHVNTATESALSELSLTTEPIIDPTQPLIDPKNFPQVDGFMKMVPKTNNYIQNNGFEDHAKFIKPVAKGEKFLFRYRGATSPHVMDEKNRRFTGFTNNNSEGIEAVVAFYTKVGEGDNAYNKIGSTILSFSGQPQVLNSKIKGGTLEDNKYWIDGVVQVPSSDYVYVTETINNEGEIVEQEYIWDVTTKQYILLSANPNKFFNYYYLVAEAKQAIPSNVFEDVTKHIGIFIRVGNSQTSKDFYFQDIELTRYFLDANNVPVTVGNIPTARAITTDYFYKAPELGTKANRVKTYTSIEEIATAIGVNPEDIKPKYNIGSVPFLTRNGNDKVTYWVKQQKIQDLIQLFRVKGYSLDKILSIEASKSNCFNILQTIAETFECWVELNVKHNEDGSLWLDGDGYPLKEVYLKGFSGTENQAGFKYGINLNSIEREINSDEIVTKLIVDPVANENVQGGTVNIAWAEANVNKEAFILNFDYFYNQGLIEDVEETKNDIAEFNSNLQKINKELEELQKRKEYLEASRTQLESRYNIYTNYVESAQDLLNKEYDSFKEITGVSYEEYRTGAKTVELSSDGIKDCVAHIYAYIIEITNYTGIKTNTELEYNKIVRQIEGLKEHDIVFQKIVDSEVVNRRRILFSLDDYVIPFSFMIGEEKYEVTLNNNTFDIPVSVDLTTINNFAYSNTENGYTLRDVNNDKVTEITLDTNDRIALHLQPNSIISGINDEIEAVIEKKSNLIREFNNKYSRFILEGTWSSQDYISNDLYYLDALQVSNVSAQPKVTYTINVADVGGIEGYENYIFDTGELTYIEDTEFFGWKIDTVEIDGQTKTIRTPIKEEIIISETEWHLDNPAENKIVVQNYKSSFEDLFQRLQATVQTVEYNEATYIKTSAIVGRDGYLNSDLLLKSLDRITDRPRVLTTDGSISIEGDKIIIQNLVDNSKRIELRSGGIFLSADGGQSFSTAITGAGINASELTSGIINTNQIMIGSRDQMSFRWDPNGLNAYVFDEGATVPTIYNHRKFVRFDQYGLYGIDLDSLGYDDTEFVARNLSDVKTKANFALTWDGFFIRNSYTDGRVEITSDNDFRVMKTINGVDAEKIKIGMIEEGVGGAPNTYGIRIKNDEGEEVFVTDDNGDLILTGTIQSANYDSIGLTGWQINQNGDAVFNNITARGAIKTAVFEYAEIQAVGGIALFRPSSTIRSVTKNGNDLILEVEKPYLFQVNDWAKISNYTTDGIDPIASGAIGTSGLSHIYRVSSVGSDHKTITLENGANILSVEGINVEKLVGGALISMGKYDAITGETTNNYGIGINSSDNTVNLPARAISLFETTVHPNDSARVSYNIRGILGTIPDGSQSQAISMDSDIAPFMYGTQGIYTDNMYIGDDNNYVAFYTNNNNDKYLDIKTTNFKLLGGTPNTNNFIYLSDTNYGENLTINEHEDNSWREIIGTNFGVTHNGNVYATNINIQGTIVAESGEIGGWTIGNNKLYAGDGTDVKVAAIEAPDENDLWVLAIGGTSHSDYTTCPFRVDKNGKLYATNADISGKITASDGQIGPWNINNNSIWYGNSTWGTSGGIYIGTSGLSIGSNFKINNTGSLTAMGANIEGVITANTFKVTYIASGQTYIAAQWSGKYLDLQGHPLKLGDTYLHDELMATPNAEWRQTVTARIGQDINTTEADIMCNRLITKGCTNEYSINASTAYFTGKILIDQHIFKTAAPAPYSQTYSAIWHQTSAGEYSICRPSSSSIKYKEDITTQIKEELNPHNLYKLPIKQFKFKENYFAKDDPYNDNRYDVIGFIAEEVEKYYSAAVIKINGQAENWNERYIIPPMLALIQEQHKEIEELKTQVKELQNK